jgi:ribosomal protein L16/L10AE
MATYRNAADIGYRKIEAANPDVLFRYLYMGPNDEKTRIFCEVMLRRNKAWTRAELAQLDNGQTGKGSVMTCAGGYNCRHSVLLAPQTIASQALAA